MTESQDKFPYKVFGIMLGAGMLLGSVFAGGDVFAFLDLPSLFIVVATIPFILFWKHGKAGLLFFKQEEKLKDEIISDGYLVTSLLAGITVVSGLVIMLANLSDQAAIGPAMAVSVLGLIYAILVIVFVFYPHSKKPMPAFVVATPIVGTMLVLLTFFVLLLSFAKA